jgi:hypothetical protein
VRSDPHPERSKGPPLRLFVVGRPVDPSVVLFPSLCSGQAPRDEESLLLTPHSSLLTPHSLLLIPYLLTPHSLLLTPYSSLRTAHCLLLTARSVTLHQ